MRSDMATSKMNPTTNDALILLAHPWAARSANFEEFAQRCLAEVKNSGEPAFFLTTQAPELGSNFPSALALWGYDEKTRMKSMVAEMPIDRPEYRSNPHGFNGSHLLKAIFGLAAQAIVDAIPEGVDIFTRQSVWHDFLASPDYEAQKTKRALERLVPQSAPVAKSRIRL